jgi:hypothetical protein
MAAVSSRQERAVSPWPLGFGIIMEIISNLVKEDLPTLERGLRHWSTTCTNEV